MRTKTKAFSHSRRFHIQQALFPIAVLILLGAIIIFFILRGANTIIPNNSTTNLIELWEEQKYNEIVELTANLLQTDPLNTNYLFYDGISNFYYALSLLGHNERQSRLDSALYSLRKLAYSPPIGYESRIHYILGKIYFYKGIFYYDLAEKYLMIAEQSSLKANDIEEHLGVINLETERYETGIEYLLRAIENNPRDILYYTVATAYENTEDYERSLEYYQLCIDLTADNVLSQESFIGQGRVLFFLNRLDQAKQLFEQVIDENSQAAEAYFYLGEIYALENDLVKARANWREAYNKNREFTPALERLNL